MKWLTTNEVAEMTGFSAGTLKKWRTQCRANNIPYYKIGKSVRYKLNEIETWQVNNTKVARGV